ncbi:MAG: lysophospholipase, partial [Verrucomicrobiota bacterium]|nr:lysophospholipase [Verrucomicrobiota bacterium]
MLTRRRRNFIRLGVLLFIYVYSVAFAHLPDRLILFPQTGRIDAGAAIRREIPFQNGKLEIWTAASGLAQRSQPQIYVLRFYGNGDRADRWAALEADAWDNRAVEVWGVNYPGYGGSTGPARLTAIGPAALAAFDALKSVAGEKPIVVFGASLGATAALHVAAKRPVAGLVLHNPPAIRQMILGKFGWWNLWLLAGPLAAQIPSDLDSIANAKAIHTPAIFLLAENDEVVPPKYHHRVAGVYAGEKRVILLKGAGHNSPIEGAALTEYH